MPRFKSIILHQNIPKIKSFLQKNAKFSSAGKSAPRPPKQPPLQISGYAPALHIVVISSKAKFKQYAFRRCSKRYKVSISRKDSGNEFHTFGDAYKNIDWDLAKFKLVTV